MGLQVLQVSERSSGNNFTVGSLVCISVVGGSSAAPCLRSAYAGDVSIAQERAWVVYVATSKTEAQWARGHVAQWA